MRDNMKRYRATVVIFRDDKVLLVHDKDRRSPHFSLPGGGFKHNETTIQAGIREVCGEEIGGIRVLSAERLRNCDLDGRRANHKVCLLTIEGEPYINRPKEIDKIIWWDMKSKIPIQGHVKYILGKLGKKSD